MKLSRKAYNLVMILLGVGFTLSMVNNMSYGTKLSACDKKIESLEFHSSRKTDSIAYLDSIANNATMQLHTLDKANAYAKIIIVENFAMFMPELFSSFQDISEMLRQINGDLIEYEQVVTVTCVVDDNCGTEILFTEEYTFIDNTTGIAKQDYVPRMTVCGKRLPRERDLIRYADFYFNINEFTPKEG